MNAIQNFAASLEREGFASQNMEQLSERLKMMFIPAFKHAESHLVTVTTDGTNYETHVVYGLEIEFGGEPADAQKFQERLQQEVDVGLPNVMEMSNGHTKAKWDISEHDLTS